MIRLIGAITFSFAQAASALAQQIVLEADQAVTLRLTDGEFVISERGAAEWTPFEVAVARRFVRGDFDHAVGPNSAATSSDGSMPEPRPIVADTVRIRFLNLANQHALLVIENGYGEALRYRATIERENQIAATDVCVVLPNLRGNEHWPYRIDRLTLIDFRLIPWAPGRAPTCE